MNSRPQRDGRRTHQLTLPPPKPASESKAHASALAPGAQGSDPLADPSGATCLPFVRPRWQDASGTRLAPGFWIAECPRCRSTLDVGSPAGFEHCGGFYQVGLQRAGDLPPTPEAA